MAALSSATRHHRRLLLLVLLLASYPGRAQQPALLTQPGTFAVGCNYWASHAGTHMWRDWRPAVIDQDFRQLAENGIKVIRVFPLWPDFQPIQKVYGGGGSVKYVGFADEQPLPTAGVGASGVSEEQLRHFEELAALAQKHHIKLIVGLITGWMSGQLYVPPALAGRDLLTDPEALVWQQKFVRTFVHRLKSQPAILAWDFGNECNVMGKVESHQQAYLWSALLAGAVKSEDTTRPLLSGMHSLSAEENAPWRIEDQAATTDVLTTHPYSLWTPYASQDGINTMRTILHAAAETRLYGDLGGKPALVEETGVMGPMTGGEKEKAAFARTALFSNWAHDCMGTLWWCAYDQLSFAYPPYNYSSVENELGLIGEDRRPKPVLGELKTFSRFIDQLPFKALPPRKTEAVCILTAGQDTWGVGYTSFVLAKQAGFDFRFQKAGQPLADAPLYLLPSLKGVEPFHKAYWFALLDKVKAGATLYISLDDAYLPTFNGPLGVEVGTNSQRRSRVRFASKLGTDSLVFEAAAERKLLIDSKQATVLAKEGDGNPVFLKTTYGKGRIYLLTFPLEQNLAALPGAFDAGQPAYASIYREIARPQLAARVLTQPHPLVGTTEHEVSPNEKVVVLINYSPSDIATTAHLLEGWKIASSLHGPKPASTSLTLKANDALVLTLRRK
ncbi:beta-mannanase [Hymenobacter arizonensis]|uniref:Endo-1,4-beta-mannosidase n=1 Tax=Hymenobacter arizonensis TaxID=1227077 RepID=A0A1I6BJB9_HYMAR|nr:beta-mannanase [Hymenobacter arizonensis]SFQ81023.1 Endo-1,4-beta-mannosidase [Hymenobacter arizonensis]